MKKVYDITFEQTNATITSRAGLVLVDELIETSGVARMLQALPAPKSGRGYTATSYIKSYLLTLLGGGNRIEDTGVIREDKALCGVLDLMVPRSDAMGDWLRTMGKKKRKQYLQAINTNLVQFALAHSKETSYTLDIDATEIVAEKTSAKIAYTGNTGYMPVLGFLDKLPLCVHGDFREGNISPADKNWEFLKQARKVVPKGTITKVRFDSAGYQGKIMTSCRRNKEIFTITARQDEAIQKTIQAIPETAWHKIDGREYAVTAHIMGNMKQAFKLTVERRLENQLLLWGKYHYHAIATNARITEKHEGEAVIKVVNHHRQRGTGEQYNKEIKGGIGLEYVPCNDFKANEIYFWLTIIAYNLFVILKHLLPVEWVKSQVKTIRWWFIGIAGQVVRHAHRITLKLAGIQNDIFIALQKARMNMYVLRC